MAINAGVVHAVSSTASIRVVSVMHPCRSLVDSSASGWWCVIFYVFTSEPCRTAACMSAGFPCRDVHSRVCACVLMAALLAACCYVAGPQLLSRGGWLCVLDVTVAFRSVHDAGW